MPKQTFTFIYALVFFLSMHVRAVIIPTNFPTDEQAEPEGGSNNLLVANYLENRNPKCATPGVVITALGTHVTYQHRLFTTYVRRCGSEVSASLVM
jgi:hypothetical protein